MAKFYGVQKRACSNDSTMIRIIRICRKCGAKIFSDVPEGLCPRCVLKSALGNFQDAAVAGGHWSAEAAYSAEAAAKAGSAKADDPGRSDTPSAVDDNGAPNN